MAQPQDDETTGVTEPALEPEAPTRRSGPLPTLQAGSTVSSVGARSTRAPVETPADAVRSRELEATRRFVRLVLVLISAVCLSLPFLEGDPTAALVLLVGFSIGLAGAARTAWVLRRRNRYDSGDAALFATTSIIAGTSGVYYFGFFSPAPLATSMGIFFFSLGRDPRLSAVIYAVTTAAHALISGLLIAGVMEDRGVISVAGVDPRNQVAITALVVVVLSLTYWIARKTSDAMLEATEEMEAAVRAVVQREALLEEARRELDRALRVGGPGRFTEQRLGGFDLGLLRGRGAMGDVYEARKVDTGDRAAVKLLHREVLRNPIHVQRFLREARIAQSLDVENVVQVLEVGGDDSPVPYMAMELLDGIDLASILRQRRRLPPDEVVEMLRQVSRGVDAAHAAGVVHRDLKPHNLFRSHDGEREVWKILDFGVSRLLDASDTLTAGQAVGTPSYMSPEQALGRRVDHRADLFALGVVAYRSLTGRPAFTGAEIPQILYNVVHCTPPQPSKLVEVPAAVDEVLLVAMAKRPADRFASGAELATAVENALAGRVDPAVRSRARRLARRFPWNLRADREPSSDSEKTV
jgi:eukaryotic-like serine/threonine-protein kinase